MKCWLLLLSLIKFPKENKPGTTSSSMILNYLLTWITIANPACDRRLLGHGQRKAARWRTKSPALNRSCTKARLCSKLPRKLSSPARSNRRRTPTTMRRLTSLTTMAVLPARSRRRLAVCVAGSVPDPPDPHVFGPPGSGSISPMYRSGSGSFYHTSIIE